MMKQLYSREAIVAAIAGPASSEQPISELLQAAGLHPYIAEVAMEVGASSTSTFLLALGQIKAEADQLGETGPGYFASESADIGTAAFSASFLRGVLTGLALGDHEAPEKADEAEQHFETIPLDTELQFGVYEKCGQTLAARVTGPFSCKTIDGNIAHCEDGWLAQDSSGYLYPIADAVFKQSYLTPA